MITIFKNGVFTDAFNTIKGDMIVKDGLIKKIGKIDKAFYEKANIMDLKGRTALPGFVDMHSHFRDPGLTYKEDIESGMKAALKGGYTSICAMANTSPICDNPKILDYAASKAKKLDLLRYFQVSALGENLEDKSLVDFKENLKYTKLFSNDGKTIFNKEFMKEALIKSRELGFTILTHCDPEEEIIKRDLELLEAVGGNLHICHISTKETVDIIRKAKEKGLKFTCEVAPHHLFKSSLDYKVNPPFGKKEDRLALIEGIKEGLIDVLATDHAPHSKEDKENGAPGINNIEYAFQIYLHIYNNYGINIHKLNKMLSFTPARLIGVNSGEFKEGCLADFCLVDLEKEEKINKENLISKSNNTPFNGEKVTGKILKTFVGGNLKYECN